MSDSHYPGEDRHPDEDPLDDPLWKLLDQHPRLKSHSDFARRVDEAARAEAAATMASRWRGSRARWFVLGALATAAAACLLWMSPFFPAGSAAKVATEAPADLFAQQLENPPEGLLEEIDLLRDLDLLEGDGTDSDIALLLDLSDLELLDRARVLWEEDVEGGE
jgi:hypothetical protein